jgi:hypothetical protein
MHGGKSHVNQTQLSTILKEKVGLEYYVRMLVNFYLEHHMDKIGKRYFMVKLSEETDGYKVWLEGLEGESYNTPLDFLETYENAYLKFKVPKCNLIWSMKISSESKLISDT